MLALSDAQRRKKIPLMRVLSCEPSIRYNVPVAATLRAARAFLARIYIRFAHLRADASASTCNARE